MSFDSSALASPAMVFKVSSKSLRRSIGDPEITDLGVLGFETGLTELLTTGLGSSMGASGVGWMGVRGEGEGFSSMRR